MPRTKPHPVAALVFLPAHGVDPQDACNAAEDALWTVLVEPYPRGPITVTSPLSGRAHVIEISKVTELGHAVRDGTLRVAAAAEAFRA